MQVLIDNQDGLGAVDYTAYVQFGNTAKVMRQLNKPSVCMFSVVVGGRGYGVPVKDARIVVLAENGVQVFTGYLPSAPELEVLGTNDTGGLYKAVVSAYSLDALLDSKAASAQALYLGQTAQQGWTSLGSATSALLPLNVAEGVPAAGRIAVAPGARWTDAAAVLANSTRSAYRATGSAVEIIPVGSVTHAVANTDPGLTFDPVTLTDQRLLASDVTICGREEPTAYVTEVFWGDGVTANFTFSQKHFEPVAAQKTSIEDLFQGVQLNPQLWVLSDPSGHVALDANGLSCTGGTGREAEATVRSVQQIELAGNTTLEAGGVQITAGSAGTILGMYVGRVQALNCFIGFGITTVAGVSNVAAVVNGTVTGGAFTPVRGHFYTLRMRIMCADVERVRQSYFFLQGTTASATGGAALVSGGWLEMEVQDTTSGLPGAPTVLYAGNVANMPPACFLGLIDSGSLVCSMQSIFCSQTAPVQVAVGASAAAMTPVYEGTAIQGASCKLTTGGVLQFYPASIPSQGSVIFVTYRLAASAVGRRTIAVGSNAAGTLSPVPMWIGTVTSPPAWSSVDCENAADALLAGAEDSSVSLRGTYRQVNTQVGMDVWPGDTLAMAPFADDAEHTAVVRKVTIELAAGAPDALAYEISFANDWAEAFSIHLSAAVPADALIPQQPTNLAAALESLSGLAVTGISGAVLTVQTGVAPPVNGGFEIRRRDNTFGPGNDSDLVARLSTSAISIPRSAPVEAFYVRMFDGASPPNYSMFSAALFVNVPL
jgi:hypothetical protein